MMTKPGLQGLLVAALLVTAASAHADRLRPDQASARDVFNRDVYGDVSGHTAPDSLMAKTSKACGVPLEVWADWASMPPVDQGTVDYCMHVVTTFEQMCSSGNFAPAVSKVVHKIECRYDGKHDPSTVDMARTYADMIQDMELKNGVFIVHMRKGHVNVDDSIQMALERDLRTHHELQAAGILPHQITARKTNNSYLYGDESGQTMHDDSILGREKAACGTKLEVTVDYASLAAPDPHNAGGCGEVIEALANACAEPAYRAVLAKLRTVDCRRDGKHAPSTNLTNQQNYEEVAKDLELSGSRLVYHSHPDHANIENAVRVMVSRAKK